MATDYYCDFVNGNDTYEGIKYDGTIDSMTDTTTLVIDKEEDTDFDGWNDDDFNGGTVVNTTQDESRLITDSTDGATTYTLTLSAAAADWNATDVIYALRPFKNINTYTSVSRSPGDNLFVRANQTHNGFAADISFASDGTVVGQISVIGCDSSTNDPFVDSSDVKPIIDFNSGVYNFSFSGDYFWTLKRFDIKNSADTSGQLYGYISHGLQIIDCVFSGAINSSTENIYNNLCRGTLLQGCDFTNNASNTNCFFLSSSGRVDDCTYNKGTAGGVGFKCDGGSWLIENSSFGQTTAFTNYDIRGGAGATIHIRNTVWSNNVYGDCAVSYEYCNSTSDTGKKTFSGSITKSTSVYNPSGASTSAKMAAVTNTTAVIPLQLGLPPLGIGVFQFWLTAAEHTITVYVKAEGVASLYPTAAQLYLKASYFNHGSNFTRAEVSSTEVLSDNTTWTALTVTFTPSQEGWVYADVYLTKNFSGDYFYVDIKPVLS